MDLVVVKLLDQDITVHRMTIFDIHVLVVHFLILHKPGFVLVVRQEVILRAKEVWNVMFVQLEHFLRCQNRRIVVYVIRHITVEMAPMAFKNIKADCIVYLFPRRRPCQSLPLRLLPNLP